jgi:hypothetical protein
LLPRVEKMQNSLNFKRLINKNAIKPKIGDPPGNFS